MAATILALALALAIASPALGQPPLGNAPQEPVALPEAIPLFPLPDIGLFPGTAQPLHIFEPRYREMIADALKGDRMIGMVMLRPGFEAEYEGRPPVYAIGCAGTIQNYQLLPDGRYTVVLRGLMKFRILSEDQSRPYRIANVEPIPETITPEMRSQLPEQRKRLVALLLEVAPGATAPPIEIPDEDVINTLSQLLPMEPADRQVLLENDGVLARSETLLTLMGLMR